MSEFYFIKSFKGHYFHSKKRGWVTCLEEATLFDDTLPINDLIKYDSNEMKLMKGTLNPIGNGKYKLKIARVDWPLD